MLELEQVETTERQLDPRRRGRILVIDDYEPVRGIVRIVLEKEGFDVCGEGADGLEAIEKARKLQPDLIILDLAMPKMNGAEAASVLSHLMPRTPIVALTMYEQYFGPTIASAVGVKAVVSKGDGLDKLVKCVESLLTKASEAPRVI